MTYDQADDRRRVDEWDRLEAEASRLSDADLLAKAKIAARDFVILWREADGRKNKTNFRLDVAIPQGRFGIIVEGYRREPLEQ